VCLIKKNLNKKMPIIIVCSKCLRTYQNSLYSIKLKAKNNYTLIRLMVYTCKKNYIEHNEKILAFKNITNFKTNLLRFNLLTIFEPGIILKNNCG